MRILDHIIWHKIQTTNPGLQGPILWCSRLGCSMQARRLPHNCAKLGHYLRMQEPAARDDARADSDAGQVRDRQRDFRNRECRCLAPPLAAFPFTEFIECRRHLLRVLELPSAIIYPNSPNSGSRTYEDDRYTEDSA